MGACAASYHLTEGKHTLYYASKDVADNEEMVHSTDIWVDTMPPLITDQGPTTGPNANGWYKDDVTNTFKAEDAFSGLSATCQAAFSSAGNTQSRTTTGEGTTVTVTSAARLPSATDPEVAAFRSDSANVV